jgi:ATP/maltotriose-dependent transcriptional regulator MalT
MQGAWESPPVVVRGKLTPPTLPERFVPRPRLADLIARLLEGHRMLLVRGTAGSGKTTAIAEAIRDGDRAVTWLTLDETDAAPGRLITYLEAALGTARPAVSGVGTGALAMGLPHTEAAGLLAEAIGSEPLAFVVDELERIAGSRDALAVLESFVRYAPAATRVVLSSRREIRIDVGRGAVAGIGEGDLAFTTDEAAEALAGLGRADIDPEDAVAMTCGWVTGVLFEAWRAADHVVGTGGEQDPLHGYLASQILAGLADEDRELLIRTSVLDPVTPARAEALGVGATGERLAALRGQYLPVTWDADELSMRCHPRFREYLIECLHRRPREELLALRVAHGHLLASEGHHEEATETFLLAGESDEARASCERAIEAVVERSDFAIAERWLEAFAEDAPRRATPLTRAELMVAVGQEQYGRGARIAAELDEIDERERLARSSARAAAAMAWCYFHVGQIGAAHAVLDAADDGPEVRAARYLLALTSPGRTSPYLPALTDGPMDALVMRVHSIRGHLSRLAASPASRWAQTVMAPWRISALRATGHTEQALKLYERMRGTDPAAVGLHALVAVEILIDLGRRDEALDALRRGRELVRRSGSIAFEMQSSVLEAKLELRLGGSPDRARSIIDRLEEAMPLREYRYISEMADTWYGLALLREGHEERARDRLERAVADMRAADRLLDLPTAATYLAEAAWRTGDEEAADRAADLAREAASRQGSNHILLQALADFPTVVSRRLDAEPEADSAWHQIGRALRSQGVVSIATAETVVELREFGRTSMLVNGEQASPRLGKTFELLAYLAAHGGDASREELLDALFSGRTDDSAQSYLRQLIRDMRRQLPAEAGPAIADGRVALGEGVRVVSESERYERLLRAAARLQGEERLEATQRALELFDRGEYLAGRTSLWLDSRREHLSSLTADACYEAAALAFAAGRYPVAEAMVERVLATDPFREGAWRLTMRVANALGDDDRIIGAYRRCASHLAEIGTVPSRSTQDLLDRLRR